MKPDLDTRIKLAIQKTVGGAGHEDWFLEMENEIRHIVTLSLDYVTPEIASLGQISKSNTLPPVAKASAVMVWNDCLAEMEARREDLGA
jgi:hypothetical protein